GLSERGVQYGLVRITPNVIKLLAEYEPHGIAGTFPDKRPPPEIKFGIGDVVSVSIFEAAAGGLFIPIEAGVRPGNFVTLPNQAIDTGGNVSIPYAGPIRAEGRTPARVQDALVEGTQYSTLDPEAVQEVGADRTNL